MGRLEKRLQNGEDLIDDDFDGTDGSADSAAEREERKRLDLRRARAREVARPIKKETRHSRVDGRYIRPDEIDKEVEKLKRAKRAQKGFFARLFSKDEPEREEGGKTPEKPTPDKTGLSLAERRKKAERIRKLRGISDAARRERRRTADPRQSEEDRRRSKVEERFSAIPEERNAAAGQVSAGFSFAESVRRLAERTEDVASRPAAPSDAGFPIETPSFAPQIDPRYYAQFADVFRTNADRIPEYAADARFAPETPPPPDGVIASALSVAVGFAYRDDDDGFVDRIITVRRLIRRRGDILIDAFCHDIAAPRLIPFSRGVKLYDLRTMTAVDDPRGFLLRVVAGVSGKKDGNDAGFIAALSVVRYDLAALAFAARADFGKSDEENRIMLAYVMQRCPTIDFDESEMLRYIAMLVPDEQSYFEAIETVVGQPRNVVSLFAHTFLQMVLSDGVLHENERELLAELLCLLRARGMDLNRLGLE